MSNNFQGMTIKPIGLVRRTSSDEDVRDRSLVSRIVLDADLTQALDGIEEWSHLFVLYWLHQVVDTGEPVLHHPGSQAEAEPVGILATRAPIRPNPLGLTLVELVERKANVLWVKGLDAFDGTPVLDIKPYPDWERGRFIVVTDFTVPDWLSRIIEQHVEPIHLEKPQNDG
jgi:tRNA-Thr(GGU) m(6)t(6)A37 methyltransferase TsaA